ncbi:DUF6114 domain-containing protein [Skermania piniformis]|uniref:Uncharacterized protein n=1 Tax=Skermania pinensis TaxID=39122 RepID=A0ABX8S761_9ACTN|nr:DUF6114 domain-containing protein [Skermania piniformis]QXQ13101.1 hypothetical protein KV203_14545 [Skermania piniformis]
MSVPAVAVERGPIAWFRRFRWSRPFWGGLLVLFAGFVIGVLPIGPLTDVVRAGPGGLAGLLCAGILIVLGLFIWFVPSQRMSAGIGSVVVSLAALPLTNLGGFIIGMTAGIVGGCMAFAWVPDKPSRAQRRLAPISSPGAT